MTVNRNSNTLLQNVGRERKMDPKVPKAPTLMWNHGTCGCCGREAMVRLVLIHNIPARVCSRACERSLVEDFDAQR